MAVEKSVQELMPPVVERTNKITLTTCEQIIKKVCGLTKLSIYQINLLKEKSIHRISHCKAEPWFRTLHTCNWFSFNFQGLCIGPRGDQNEGSSSSHDQKHDLCPGTYNVPGAPVSQHCFQSQDSFHGCTQTYSRGTVLIENNQKYFQCVHCRYTYIYILYLKFHRRQVLGIKMQ